MACCVSSSSSCFTCQSTKRIRFCNHHHQMWIYFFEIACRFRVSGNGSQQFILQRRVAKTEVKNNQIMKTKNPKENFFFKQTKKKVTDCWLKNCQCFTTKLKAMERPGGWAATALMMVHVSAGDWFTSGWKTLDNNCFKCLGSVLQAIAFNIFILSLLTGWLMVFHANFHCNWSPFLMAEHHTVSSCSDEILQQPNWVSIRWLF